MSASPTAPLTAEDFSLIGSEFVKMPTIAIDGPYRPCENRLWLARQLLDSRMTDEEAYSVVAFSPAIQDAIEDSKAALLRASAAEGAGDG